MSSGFCPVQAGHVAGNVVDRLGCTLAHPQRHGSLGTVGGRGRRLSLFGLEQLLHICFADRGGLGLGGFGGLSVRLPRPQALSDTTLDSVDFFSRPRRIALAYGDAVSAAVGAASLDGAPAVACFFILSSKTLSYLTDFQPSSAMRLGVTDRLQLTDHDDTDS